MTTNLVPISKVSVDADQPRKFFDEAKLASLGRSIKAHGILNPLVVEKTAEGYLLVDGERRYRAAKAVGLKEVPITVIASKDKQTRSIEQFHLQEMHEGWSPTEKSEVIGTLCQETGKTFSQVCVMLNIKPDNARKLWAISRLSEKAFFQEKNISVEFAEPLVYLTSFVKKMKEAVDEPFTLGEKKKLERAVIKNISEGNFTSSRDVTKLKDTFKSNPKMIEKFIAGEDANTLFVESKARAAYHLRNATNMAGYLQAHVHAFLKDPRVKLEEKDGNAFRGAYKALIELAGQAGIELE